MHTRNVSGLFTEDYAEATVTKHVWQFVSHHGFAMENSGNSIGEENRRKEKS